jgi:hypothetical protein
MGGGAAVGLVAGWQQTAAQPALPWGLLVTGGAWPGFGVMHVVIPGLGLPLAAGDAAFSKHWSP